MLLELARRWWVFLVRGLLAILFGIFAFLMPGVTLLSLVFIFGVYALIDGIASIVLGLAGRTESRSWWAMMLVGIIGIGAGIAAFVWPGITAIVLLSIIAAWSVVRGIFEVIAAIKLREVIEGEWFLGLAGLMSILFGVLLVLWPQAGAVAVVWIIGFYALLFGVIHLALAFRLRRLRERLGPTTHARPADRIA